MIARANTNSAMASSATFNHIANFLRRPTNSLYPSWDATTAIRLLFTIAARFSSLRLPAYVHYCAFRCSDFCIRFQRRLFRPGPQVQDEPASLAAALGARRRPGASERNLPRPFASPPQAGSLGCFWQERDSGLLQGAAHLHQGLVTCIRSPLERRCDPRLPDLT
jgi:hypothetical protein